MLFIGPPFGNYISLPNTISINGSFTLHPRPGLLSQIWNTLHYSKHYNGWINKIGLRNPGIDAAIRKYKVESTDVYSIAILHQSEIPDLLEKIPEKMNIELNVSCPNTEKHMINDGLGGFINQQRKWCIVKLSPEADDTLIDKFYEQGFRQFHCSNTLPLIKGGLSGPSLRPYTSNLVKRIKARYPDTEVIAGGGIQTETDIQAYQKVGANHFAMSTLFFHPILASKFFWNFYKKKLE